MAKDVDRLDNTIRNKASLSDIEWLKLSRSEHKFPPCFLAHLVYQPKSLIQFSPVEYVCTSVVLPWVQMSSQVQKCFICILIFYYIYYCPYIFITHYCSRSMKHI